MKGSLMKHLEIRVTLVDCAVGLAGGFVARGLSPGFLPCLVSGLLDP